MSKPIRVLIADDHPAIRMALTAALEHVDDVEVVGAAQDGAEAVELANLLQPDVVVMDVLMPRMSGVEATRRILSGLPASRVVGLSLHDGDVGDEICEAGATTFISKFCDHDIVVEAIRYAASSPPRKPR
jgi:DNA-binding NarL/FixJ family response regulator